MVHHFFHQVYFSLGHICIKNILNSFYHKCLAKLYDIMEKFQTCFKIYFNNRMKYVHGKKIKHVVSQRDFMLIFILNPLR